MNNYYKRNGVINIKIKTKDMTLIALFTALMAASAYFKIAVSIIPFSLQLFFAILSGMILGSRLGFLSQVVYIFIGLCGIPVFANGGGITYIFQPSFGYIIGFAAASFMSGKIMELGKKHSLIKCYVSAFIGIIIIYIFGITYLYGIFNLYLLKHIDFSNALTLGLYPFIIKDSISGILLGLVSYKIIPILKKQIG